MKKTGPVKLPLRNGFQEILERFNTPFTIGYTSNTTTLQTELYKYMATNSAIPLKELAFVKQVKGYNENLILPKVDISPKGINYFKFRNLQPGEYNDIIEVDVNAAYWNIAKEKGYLSEELYQKGGTVSKMARLVALGAMASNQRQYQFTGERYNYIGEKVNERTRSYFFDVAKTLDIMMMEGLESFADVIFYWVDAFFVRRASAKKIADFFDAHDLGVKYKEVDKLVVEEKKGVFWITAHMADGKEKPFCYVPEGNRAQFHINSHTDILAKARAQGLI